MKTRNFMLGLGLAIGANTASALNIALTNDDGWSTPGIQAVFEALTEAGHTVTLAGPLNGQSGSSAALNFDALEIVKRAENQFSVALEGGTVGAEPATSGAVASHISEQLTGQAPDLLVSGINSGANLSTATQISGTVGAAIVSISRIVGESSIPAIAISSDDRCPEEEGIIEECREVADFLVDYIDHLADRPNFVAGKSPLIPGDLALNINYPPGEPVGVRVAKQGLLPVLDGRPIAILLGCGAENCNDLEIDESASGGITGVVDVSSERDRSQSDGDLFLEGYITIVPIKADYTANNRSFKRYLRTYHD